MRMRLLRPQAGRTLIELMVAIALGMLILLGVGGLYVASQQSTRSATSVASADNTGQVALALIGASVRRAGFSELAAAISAGSGGGEDRRASLAYQGPPMRGCSTASFGSNNPANACGTAVAGAPDSLAVWFQADNALGASQGGGATADCAGNLPGFSAVNVSVPGSLVVAQNLYYVDTTNQTLMCRGGTPAAQGTATPVLSGVEDFKVFYGFDGASYGTPAVPGNPAPLSVRTAAEMALLTAPTANLTAWDYVVSVTVCVLVRTEEASVSTQGSSATYQPCPQTSREAAGLDAISPVASPDGRIRRAVVQTFSVRSATRPNPLAG